MGPLVVHREGSHLVRHPCDTECCQCTRPYCGWAGSILQSAWQSDSAGLANVVGVPAHPDANNGGHLKLASIVRLHRL